MNLAEIGSLAAAVISAVSLWRSVRDKRFESIEKKIDELKSGTEKKIDELKLDMKEGFNKIDRRFEKVDEQFKELRIELKSEIASVGGEVLLLKDDIKRVQTDISDVKERVTFMEAFMFFSEFTAESNNPRSESAKKMWERRKSKQVAKKDS